MIQDYSTSAPQSKGPTPLWTWGLDRPSCEGSSNQPQSTHLTEINGKPSA